VKRRLGQRLLLGRLIARRAGANSLPRVAEGLRGAVDYFERTEHERSPERLATRLLAEALADAARRLFVLEDEKKQPVGLLDLALDTPCPREATVALLVLSRQRRGLGLGREVAETLFDALGEAGYERVRLGVAPGEREAADFWNAVGMWPCGEEGGVRLFERPLR
jgi:ribosomal protein S18 acetylase RimI-like enzyme